jgi:RND family efflux transporter MFP subunit
MRPRRHVIRLCLFVAASFPAAVGPAAQPPGMPPTPVRYTEAREQAVNRILRLPGAVESRTAGVVASEVAGLVIELPAREGKSVERDQPLARLRTTALELRLQAATGQLREAEARARLAETNLARSRELFSQKVASEQQLDDARSDLSAWQGRLETLKAEIERIQFDIDRSTIRAPYSGTVTIERAEIGTWIDVGSPVVEMISMEDLEVRVEVPERYYRNLQTRGRVSVTFGSVPGLEVEGRISAVIPRADPQARTFPLKVRIPNGGRRIGVGMLAEVALPAGETYRATLVPKDAVVRQGQDLVVFLLNGDQTVERAAITTSEGAGDWVVVEGSVKPGQKVITRGNERLQPGQPVRGEPIEYALP